MLPTQPLIEGPRIEVRSLSCELDEVCARVTAVQRIATALENASRCHRNLHPQAAASGAVPSREGRRRRRPVCPYPNLRARVPPGVRRSSCGHGHMVQGFEFFGKTYHAWNQGSLGSLFDQRPDAFLRAISINPSASERYSSKISFRYGSGFVVPPRRSWDAASSRRRMMLPMSRRTFVCVSSKQPGT